MATDQIKDVLIVGAGMAGLMAAQRLREAGATVTVIDKGRGVGGRMATRRLEVDGVVAHIDHGAQYFTCYSEQLRPYLAEWEAAGMLRVWSDGFVDSDGEGHFNGEPRYVGMFGMTTVPKYLAQGIDLHTATRIEQITYDNGYLLTSDNGQRFYGRSLLLTPPAEQTLALLDSGNLEIGAAVRQQLQQISYEPCFALLVVLDQAGKVPPPGGVWPVDGEPVSWIADNQQKGISPVAALTIHSGPQFARDHFDEDQQHVGDLLLEAARPWLGDANVIARQIQRWRYSKPESAPDEDYLFVAQPAPLLIAGDAFKGGRVEGAALSGMAAAERLLAATAGTS